MSQIIEMRCPQCKQDIDNINTYFVHLRYIHSITDYFVCPYDYCKRVYQLKNSMKRHISSCHIVSDRNAYCNVEKVSSASDSTPLALTFTGTSVSNVEKIRLSDVTPDITMQVNNANECNINNQTENEKSFLSHFKSEVHEAVLAFISQLVIGQ